MVQEIFRARNVNVPNDKGHGLVNLNMSVRKGEILGIFGNRYAGRNKLLKLIMGEIHPESGTLLWEHPESGNKPKVTKLCSASMLIDELTIWENMIVLWEKRSLAEIMNMRKLQKMIALFLNDYGLQFRLDDKVKQLSQIEKLSLEILAARHNRTDLLLIDGTDIEGTTVEYQRLKQLLLHMKQEGMTIVYINFQMNLLFFLSDRIAILHRGSIIKILKKEKTSQAELKRIFSTLYKEEKLAPRTFQAAKKEIFSINNLNAGLRTPVSFSVNEGEFVTVISPRLELFSILQARITQGVQCESSSFYYQGSLIKKLWNNKEIYFLNAFYLDNLIEELSPIENLCLGIYERFTFLGFEKPDMLRCLEQEFYDWYGHKGILQARDCSSLYRKDRIAINLFWLRFLKAKMIICNDISIHNDLETYHIVRKCLAELLDKGTAVCMITGDSTYHDDIVERYVFLEKDYE
ncbi:MAG: ATP-binding cassette domain-containing protein [Lachnospiraceae bacterium]|nr:ATP-binding cassette domain-containing protein [Lachnospiraceae bacterium]